MFKRLAFLLFPFLFLLNACGGGGSSSAGGGAATQPSGITTPSQVNVVTPSN
ncbi:hypothetical protein [Limnobacter sp.]|uniref:hypothetical protein n=1 Tax=Limnobacter sp. TaxID=2003368 RepID=UPI003517B062